MAAARSTKLASDLKAREVRLLELQVEQNEIEAAHVQVAERRDAAADAELANDLAVANRLRGEAAKLEDSTRAREGELNALVPRLEAKIVATKSDLERAHFDEALARRDEKSKQAAKLARSIASALPIADILKLEQLRAEADDLDARARELARPLDADVDLMPDEPSFGNQAALDILQAGARQLNAETRAEAERQAAKAKADRPDRIRRAVQQELDWVPRPRSSGGGSPSPIERLDGDLRDDSIDAYAKALKRLPDEIRQHKEVHLKELRGNAQGLAENAQAGGGAELDRGPLAPIAA